MNRIASSLLALVFAAAATSSPCAPFAWVPHGRGVTVIDVATASVVAELPLGDMGNVATLPDRRYAFAVRGSQILVLDSVALAPVAAVNTIALSGLWLAPGRELAYVRFTTDAPVFVSARRLDTEARSFLPSPAPSILDRVVAFSRDGAFAYFDGRNVAASVAEVDVAANVELRRIALPSAPGFGGAVHPRLNRLYLPLPSQNAIAVVDLAVGALISTIPVGGFPIQLIFDAPGDRIFVTLDDASAVDVLDATTQAFIARIPVGNRPSAIDIAPAGNHLYVVNRGSDSVSVIDVAGLRVASTIAVGPSPRTSARFIGGISASVSFTPGPATGLWWNPSEPGWGIHIIQRRSTFFAALFHYDANRVPKWFVAPSCVPNVPCPDCVDGVICQGTIYEANGPAFFFVPFNPDAVQRREAGLMEIQFASRDSAALTYVIGGQQRRVQIRRQVFAPQATLATDYTDLWWNPLESGWGLGIAQQSNIMFLAWFVYDESGRPSWYVASNCTVIATGNGCRGTLYRATGPLGPVPGAAGFDSAALRVNPVGTIDVAFEGANNGTITYVVDGRPGTKTITRQLF